MLEYLHISNMVVIISLHHIGDIINISDISTTAKILKVFQNIFYIVDLLIYKIFCNIKCFPKVKLFIKFNVLRFVR